MKYVSCLLLESGLAFTRLNEIKPCAPGSEIFWAKSYNGEPFDVDGYLRQRAEYIEMMKQGNPPEQCIGCSNLEERDWPEEPGIEYISISVETKCSCNCYYCVFSKNKEYYNNKRGYDIMPVLSFLRDRNLLRHTTLDIVGGECTEYPPEQLQALVNFVIENKLWCHFFSSGLFYSEIIAETLKETLSNIIVSIDAGTKELYEKIKNVNAYDRVWENMAKYSAVGVPDTFLNKGFVILKYIIIPGVNDSIDEIKLFAKKSKEAGCKWLRFSVEYEWWNQNSENTMDENLWKILDYTESLKQDFRVEYIENAIYLWRKRMIEDKNYAGVNPCENAVAC
jgi:molybdenum cofactor biosynthesis enzyme MoaA